MSERRGQDDDLRWAAEVAPQLLAQARAEALEEARAQLRSRLVDALLDRARLGGATEAPPRSQRATEAPPRSRRATEAPPREPPSRQQFGLWAYGVMEAEAAGPLENRGVDPAHDVELIRHARLAALVSPVPLDAFGERALQESLEDLDRLERLARAHERVLEAALRRGAVVPFRICTIYESEARVQAMLAREHDHLAAALRHLHGMAEWGVKAYAVGRVEDEAAVAEPSSGTDYLSRKRAARDAAEHAREAVGAAAEAVHAQLRERAADSVLSPPQAGPLATREGEMVLNAAYLVADADVSEFRALVDELGERHARDGLELELTGPWPAYHFSDAGAG
jgi:hypothetical protein